MEEKKVRVCKKCGTELIEISPPKDIEDTELASGTTWGYVKGDGPEIGTVGKSAGKGHWPGQYQCPKCDPGGQDFVGETQTEFKNIQGISREQEIELSMKAKEEIERNESSVIWDDGPEPGKGWND